MRRFRNCAGQSYSAMTLCAREHRGKYEPAVKFGEYASPDFGTTVDTVGKARQYGVMSLETSVEQLYGDTWTKEEKEAEIARLKEEQGIGKVEEPGVNLDAGGFKVDTGGDGLNDGKNRRKDLGSEPKEV